MVRVPFFLLSSFSLLLLPFSSIGVVPVSAQGFNFNAPLAGSHEEKLSKGPIISSALFAAALNHAVQVMPSGSGTEFFEKLKEKDLETLYAVAESMYKNPRRPGSNGKEEINDQIHAVEIWHAIADNPYMGHIPSMISLGWAYSENDRPKAIEYFLMAGKGGPHQAALYNAGRLLIEEEDYPAALDYIRKAATKFDDASMRGSGGPQLKKTCMEGYEYFSQNLMGNRALTIQQMVDIFPYAHINGWPHEGSGAIVRWAVAMSLLEKYSEASEDEKDYGHLDEARKNLEALQKWDKDMSELQKVLVKRILESIALLVRKGSPSGDEL